VIVGLALHRFAIEPARGASAVVLIIITIGASIFLRGAAQVVFDKRFTACRPGSATIPFASGAPPSCRRAWWCSPAPSSLSCCCGSSSIAPCSARRLSPLAANQLAARLVGINPRRIVGLSFAISAAIGAVAGILIAPITLTSYDVGTLPGAQGLRRRDARRHGQRARRCRGRACCSDCSKHSPAGYLSSQYKDAVAFPRHPDRAVRHAARSVRAGVGRAGVRATSPCERSSSTGWRAFR
jgi:branched-chain amino acid transport system permease protein